MGDVQNNIEDEKQARSQAFVRGGAIQQGDGPKSLEGQVSREERALFV